MSNSLAVAAATAALGVHVQDLIIGAGPLGVAGARVTTLNPGNMALRDGLPAVNLYLYRTERNGAATNRDLPTRAAAGRPLAYPSIKLDLDFMVSFFGDDARLEPQRLLGCVVGGLHAAPMLDRTTIQRAIDGAEWLTGSTLADDGSIRVMPAELASDVMARLWSEFVQIPYQLTVLYRAMVVGLDVPLAVTPALPVRRLGVDARPAGPITVRGVVDARQPDLPLASGRTIAILMSDPGLGLRVRLNDVDAVQVRPGLDAYGRPCLLVPMTADQPGLTAGRLTIQVEATAGPHRTVVAWSPGLSFVLLPAVARPPSYDAAKRTITVRLALPLAKGASASLVLFPSGGASAGAVIASPAPASTVPAAPSGELTFPSGDAAPGSYLVMVESGGLRSLLDMSGGRYVGPVLRIGAGS